jgi:tetratricopeptide (TPR) repeat protein
VGRDVEMIHGRQCCTGGVRRTDRFLSPVPVEVGHQVVPVPCLPGLPAIKWTFGANFASVCTRRRSEPSAATAFLLDSMTRGLSIPPPVGRSVIWVASCVVMLTACLVPTLVQAEEAYERFLQALKERGLFDVALHYTQSMRTSPLLTDAQKLELPLAEGQLLVDYARAEGDPVAKTRLLDQARDRFTEFVKSNPAHPKSAVAETELGNVLMERGRNFLQQANRPAHAAQRDALVKQSRELYEQARNVFEAAETKFNDRYKSFPKVLDAKKDAKRIEQRKSARDDLLRAQLFSAGIRQELAKTYDSQSAEHKKLLQDAAERCKTITDKYPRLGAAVIARLREGECYQDLGDTKRAIGIYESLLSEADDASVRPLKTHALLLTLQCLASNDAKNFEMAVQRGEDWLQRAPPAEMHTPDGLGIAYITALASKNLADALTNDDPQRKRALLAAAKKHAQSVIKASSLNNPYRELAQQLSSKLIGTEGESPKEPTNFIEAVDRAQALLDRWQERQNAIKTHGEGEGEAGPLREQARHYFQLALKLRDHDTPLDGINVVRYYLSFLDYQAGDYYDAAVLGEFVARNYPKSQGGRNCAKIAMHSYLQNFEAARKAQRNNEFDREKMIEIADYITSAWPGSEEADEAWNILLQLAVGEGQLDKALAYLAKIPENSPRRGDAELKAGHAVWAAYLSAARRGEARPPQVELDKMFATARKLLDAGLKRTRSAVDSGAMPVSATMPAALALAQIYVESGESAKAIDLLNDAKTGPLALVAAGNPVTKQGNFAAETYKLALRAYVANQALDKAETTMQSLEKLVNESGDADAAGQLTRIYIALGHELEQQLERLRQEHQTDELNKISKGFELFLDRISARETGNTFNSLNWVAETLFSLGTGYDVEGPAEASPEAKAYYEKSLDADSKIIGFAKSDNRFAREGALLSVKLRMARTERRLQQFQKSYDLLVDVLKEKSNLLDAQLEAARTLQDWGAQKPECYLNAIAGDVKDKALGRQENVMWGWAKIAVRTQSQKNLQAAFYEARYNQARCYLELGKTKTGPSRNEMLQLAERDIVATYRVRPQLGGPAWKKKFDLLLRDVQQQLGNAPTGLPTEPDASRVVQPVTGGAP